MTMRKIVGWVLLATLSVGAADAPAGDRPKKSNSSAKRQPIQQVAFGPELRAPDAEVVVPRLARGGLRSPLMLAPALTGAPSDAPAPVPGGLPQPPMAVPPIPDGPGAPGEFVNPIPEPVPMEGYSVSLLYPNVRYKDLKNIPACAVPMIVAVPHPCKECCCAYVQICVPPNCCPKISRKKNGYEVEYDYGDFEVEIKSRDGLITVDYDD